MSDLETQTGADLLENLLYTYRHFVQENGMEPNAWLTHPLTWQQCRLRLLQYTMGGIERLAALPVFPAVNENPLHPPSLMGLPVICSTGIQEGTILAARVQSP